MSRSLRVNQPIGASPGIVFHAPQVISIFSRQVAPCSPLPHHLTFPDQSNTFFFLACELLRQHEILAAIR
jgi:hypothetical protein